MTSTYNYPISVTVAGEKLSTGTLQGHLFFWYNMRMDNSDCKYLKARAEALMELSEQLTDEEYDIAEKAIDLYMDIIGV